MAHEVKLTAIKTLREQTSMSLADVKRALETAARACSAPSSTDPSCRCEANALKELQKRGAQISEKRQDRATGQGRVEAYVHHDGRIGVLIDVNCETDFVARTPDFTQFCRDVAMHIAAMNPRCVQKDQLPVDATHETCLLDQPFVKDPSTTIQQLLEGLVAKTGERVVIRRFARFMVG